jgi:hypothetical protein
MPHSLRVYQAQSACPKVSRLQGKTDFECDLPVTDLTLLDKPSGFSYLKPAHIMDCLGGFADRPLDRVFDAGRL